MHTIRRKVDRNRIEKKYMLKPNERVKKHINTFYEILSLAVQPKKLNPTWNLWYSYLDNKTRFIEHNSIQLLERAKQKQKHSIHFKDDLKTKLRMEYAC